MRRIMQSMVVVCFMVALGNVVQADDKNPGYATLVAAFKGNAAEVQQLLDQGASPDYACQGVTPLIACSLKGHLNVAKLLVARGADVNLRSPRGPSALMTAAANNHLELVRFLLDHGAEPNAQASFVWTTLTLTGDACRDADQLGAVDELCEGEKCCMTALCVASDKTIRDLLVQHGAKE